MSEAAGGTGRKLLGRADLTSYLNTPHHDWEKKRGGTWSLSSSYVRNPHITPQVFLTASAVGFYGYDEGERTFDESGPQGKGFLAEVTRVWEAEANKLKGKRVSHGVEWWADGR